jgi:hypothetical protein
MSNLRNSTTERSPSHYADRMMKDKGKNYFSNERYTKFMSVILRTKERNTFLSKILYPNIVK